MKKILYSALFLGSALALASCSSDEPVATVNDGSVSFKVSLPEMGTRAFGDEETINCNELYYTVFDQSGKVIISDTRMDAFGPAQLTAQVNLKLVANQDYKIVFYAHNNKSEFSSYEAGKIEVNYSNYNSNSELDDAFVKMESFTADGVEKTVVLTRPFAQVNVGTDDMKEEAVENLVTNLTGSLTVTQGLYSSFDILNNEVGDAVTDAYTFTAADIKDNTDFPVVSNGITYSLLTEVYLLVEDAESLINGSYTLTHGDANTEIRSFNLDGTPVQMNYRTNIFGTLLTTDQPFNIEIDPIFAGDADFKYEEEIATVYSAAGLAAALKNVDNGARVIVAADIANAGRINIPADKTVTIDLNGKNINGVCFVAYTGADVTFTGEGNVTGGSALAAVTAYGSTVNIEGGNFVAGLDSKGESNSCIYSEKGGIVNISGGTFKVQKSWTNSKGEVIYFVLNRQNGSTGTFSCTGGSFYNYNPANGDDSDKGLNWVAEGYTVEQDGDVYTVVAE